VTELLAFSADHACVLTRLSKRQLGYWDKTGFFSPQYADENRQRPYSRIYSFRDVVGLRTIALLRNEHNVPLQELRRVGSWLKKQHRTPWASLKFYVSGKRVYFDDPRTGSRRGARPLEQTVLPIEMQEVAQEVSKAAGLLQQRQPDDVGKIIRHRYLVHNAPVLAGTRVPTSAVWNLHEAGYSRTQIIREFPRLKTGDVTAAIGYEKKFRKSRVG
jgi:DNA-binding transcriptional MerR regulator